jgi:GTP cyclohydrolase I
MKVTYQDIKERIEYLRPQFGKADFIYGVPRGGVPVALMMAIAYGCKVVDDPDKATIIVDDLIDSGRTRSYYKAKYPHIPFVALYNKINENINTWLIFPWEIDQSGNENSAEDIFVRLLEYIGEDPERGGLKDTPKRMAAAWKEWTSGYNINPRQFVKTFDDGAEQYDEMVLEKNIPFYSHCEHHLAPFFGVAHVAYIPSENSVLGISKLARIVDMYARRLQIQERMTNQIAATIHELINPAGVAVVLDARHLCMESRGIRMQGQSTITSAMLGVFRDKMEARNEFLQLIK